MPAGNVIARAILAGALGASLVASVVGCTHGGAASTTPANTAPTHHDFAGDELSLVPATMALVVGADWSQLRTSAVYTQFVQAKVDAMPEVQMVRTTCGFDPLAAMAGVTFATSDIDNAGVDSELVVRGISRDQALACFPKLVTSAPPTTKVHQEGDTWLISGDGPTVAVRFVSDSVAVLAVGARASAAGIDALLAGGASALPTSKGFTDLHDQVRKHTQLWFVANLSAKPSTSLPGASAAFGGLDVTDGLALDTTLRFAAEEGAASSAAQLKSMTGQLGMFTDKLDIAANGKDVVVAAAMSHAKLTMVLGMLGGGGGGGGGMPAGPPQP